MPELGWIETERELACLAPEWDALLLRTGVDDPFLASDFLLAWWHCFGGGRALRIALWREKGDLRGGLPLYAERAGARTRLCFPGALDHALANRTDFLAPAEELPALAEALARDLAARADWDDLALPRWHRGAREADGLVEAFERHDQLLRYRHRFPRYLLEVPTQPEEHLRRASRSFRKHLARAQRSAAGEGELVLHELAGEAEALAAFRELAAFSRAAFARRGGRSTFEDPRLCAFFEDLLPAFARRGWLHAHRLCLGERPIALSIGYSLQGEWNDVITAYDPAHASLSPGMLLTWEQLVRAPSRGVTEIDFATGDNPHKQRFATRREAVVGLYLERSTPARRAAAGLRRLARALLPGRAHPDGG